MKPGKALAIMALPTIASQLILLIYNLADTWFIGRTNNPYMIGASSLALTVYLVADALNALIACMIFYKVNSSLNVTQVK